MVKNIIRQVKEGQSDGESTGFDLARKVADEHQEKTGNKCIVERYLMYADMFNGERREHSCFHVIELL